MPTITGTSGNDNLVGTADGDEIYGLEGDDVIEGGSGGDILDGGDGDDTIVISEAGGDAPGGQVVGGDGHDILDLRAVQVTADGATNGFYANGQYFSLSGIEEIWLGDVGNTTSFPLLASGLIIRSGAGDDDISGTYSADVVYGGGGNDIFRNAWGTGADRLFGEGGDDTFHRGVSDAVGIFYSGGSGIDTLWTESYVDVEIDMSAGTGTDYDSVIFTFASIENLALLHFFHSVATVRGTNSANHIEARAEPYNNVTLVVDGRGGDDTLLGGIYDDDLKGGDGADVLEGRDGQDRLTGGAGNDTIDGGRGVDVAVFEGALADYVITEGPEYGTLIVTRDGETDTLRGINVLEFADQTIAADVDGLSLSGTGEDETLEGDEWNDTLQGLEGDDTLDGFEGDDLLEGGAGDDILSGGLGDDIVHGGDGADILNTSAGADQLNGGAGDDLIRDTSEYGLPLALEDGLSIDGGDGVDTLWITQQTQVEYVINLQTGVGQLFERYGGPLISTFTFSDIENVLVEGNWERFTLTGDDGDNSLGGYGDYLTLWNYSLLSIDGAGGDDYLAGGALNDVLSGGTGNDILIGGYSNDSLSGGSGIDTADYWTSDAGVTVDLASGTGAGGHADGDTLTGIENLFGSTFDDTLLGNSFGNVLTGAVGADVLDGRGGSDTASYAGSDFGVSINLATSVATGGHAAGDTLISIENLIGTDHSDVLTGDAGANRLDGGAGDDQLSGGAGADAFIGGDGTDTVRYADATAGVKVYLSTGSGGGWAAGDTFSGIETVIGSVHDDLIVGDGGHNLLQGAGGADVVRGGAGDDQLYGAAGDDVLEGGDGADIMAGGDNRDTLQGDAGDDVLNGGAGVDKLFAGAGNDELLGGADNDKLNGGADHDSLNGGQGDDILTGGSGDDWFVFEGNSGADVITDFRAGAGVRDVIVFADGLFTSLADVKAHTVNDGLGNCIISKNGVSITLTGVTVNQLVADDFQFPSTPSAPDLFDPLVLPVGLDGKGGADEAPVVCPPGEAELFVEAHAMAGLDLRAGFTREDVRDYAWVF